MCVKKVLFAANRGKKETFYETRRRKLFVCIELAPPCVTHGRGEPFTPYLLQRSKKLIASSSAFMRASSLVGHVLEGRAVLSQVQTDELHDALTAHDVAAEVANHVDNVLCKVLEFACFF